MFFAAPEVIIYHLVLTFHKKKVRRYAILFWFDLTIFAVPQVIISHLALTSHKQGCTMCCG